MAIDKVKYERNMTVKKLKVLSGIIYGINNTCIKYLFKMKGTSKN